MGDLQTSMPPFFSATSSVLTELPPLSVDSELWLLAEHRTQEILCTIQPVVAAEQKRKGVINYIRTLTKHHYGAEAEFKNQFILPSGDGKGLNLSVVAFGSVPLKTYLPDGDIDLTVLIHPNIEEDLARDICRILKHEEEKPEYLVKDIQYIQAQVKVVRCCVNNISVDISFNQMAGLCSFYFLEQVDQFIGKEHLLKRSIILIKAWCFYESRILGAHHGLISTYALEVLVLCILNLFHESLPGPLAVLHRFLDFYSKFDWERYGISIDGPIPVSSLSKITAESTEGNGNGLFSCDFLRSCKESFSASMAMLELGAHEFPVKHLNIVDPLKDGNNLGRSVNKGNCHRIRCALFLGAQKLGEALELPGESMGLGLEKFFRNTLDRNGRGQRPDAQEPVPAFGTGRSEVADLCGEYSSDFGGLEQSHFYGGNILAFRHQLIPSSPSEIHLIRAGNFTSLMCKQNGFPQSTKADVFSPTVQNQTDMTFVQNSNDLYDKVARNGADLYVPMLENSSEAFSPIVPLRQPYSPEHYSARSSINIMPKSRGTGTYIPKMTCHPFRDFRSWVRRRTQFFPTQRQRTRSRRTDGIEHPPGAEESGNGTSVNLLEAQAAPEAEESDHGSLDFSLEEFPHLPSIKESSSEIHESCEPIFESPKIKGPGPVESLEFGTFGRLPTPPLVLSGTEQNSVELNQDSVHGQFFQLTDDEDFPPLCP